MTGESQQRHQEAAYPDGHDYKSETPHLKHHWLYDLLLAQIRSTVDGLAARGLPLRVLDVGAGDGAFVEPLLAAGCDVTATEMSGPSVERLSRLYGRNERFRAVFDGDGSLGPVAGERFSLVLYGSVLHHIPDYLAAIESSVSLLAPGGGLVSVQDPLWYPRMRPAVHRLSEAAFLAWRVSRGNLRRGAASRVRRWRGTLDERLTSDTVEFHVVRQGVDEEAVRDLLRARFATVTIIPYWSTFTVSGQRLGERVGLANTFAAVAEDRRPR